MNDNFSGIEVEILNKKDALSTLVDVQKALSTEMGLVETIKLRLMEDQLFFHIKDLEVAQNNSCSPGVPPSSTFSKKLSS